MTSPTPGPWDWMTVGASASGGFHLYIIDATKRKIAALWGKADEKTANACLISAAPDLLRLAHAVAETYEGVESGLGYLARAAIAKATNSSDLARPSVAREASLPE